MPTDFRETVFDALGGFNDQLNPADLPQDPRKVISMAQAQNVYQPGDRHDLMTIPGFTKVRSTAINANGIGTGGVDMSEISTSDQILSVSIAGSSHNFYRNNANPPGAITGGTNLTIGQDNLVDFLLFTDGSSAGAIALSRLRNTPQFFNSSITRSNFTIAGTGLTALKPGFGEVFGQRAIYASVDRDGTVEDDFWYWSDVRDGNLITDYLTQRESVQTKEKDKIRAVKRLSDVMMIGKLNNVFVAINSPLASRPFAQRELPAGRFRGPMGQQGVIEADNKLFWNGQHNFHTLDLLGKVEDIGDPLRGTLAAIADDDTAAPKLEFAVAGHSLKDNLVLWNVAPAGATNRTRTFAYNYKTKQWFLWTRTRNMYFNAIETSVVMLYGMGLTGFLYEELNGSTGNADDATALIDADIITPRHHLGLPGTLKLFAGLKVVFDQQGSESVTVQYRLDDASSWSSFAESPYTVTGTAGDVDEKFFPLMAVGKYIQLRFRDANSGEAMRIQKYAIVFKPLSEGFTGLA